MEGAAHPTHRFLQSTGTSKLGTRTPCSPRPPPCQPTPTTPAGASRATGQPGSAASSPRQLRSGLTWGPPSSLPHCSQRGLPHTGTWHRTGTCAGLGSPRCAGTLHPGQPPGSRCPERPASPPSPGLLPGLSGPSSAPRLQGKPSPPGSPPHSSHRRAPSLCSAPRGSCPAPAAGRELQKPGLQAEGAQDAGSPDAT